MVLSSYLRMFLSRGCRRRLVSSFETGISVLLLRDGLRLIFQASSAALLFNVEMNHPPAYERATEATWRDRSTPASYSVLSRYYVRRSGDTILPEIVIARCHNKCGTTYDTQ